MVGGGRRRKQEGVGHATGAVPPRGNVDGETLKYFWEVSSLLDSVKDAQERATLCAHALEEARGKEVDLACHSACSRVLERLLLVSDLQQNMAFLERCYSKFATMAMDPSGSHVAEALLKALAAALERAPDDKLLASLEPCLVRICQVLKENAVPLMTSRFGSHVFRCCLLLLSGKAAEPERNALTKKLGKAIPRKTLHPGFPQLLKGLTSELLELAGASLDKLRVDPFASPVLQAILRALEGNKEAVTDAVALLLKGDGDTRVEEILEMVENQSGSHLMEVIVEEAPNPLYMELLQQFFLHNLGRLAFHHVANFVVQTLISSARQQGQVKLILDELNPHLTELIRHRRGGVVASLAAACGRFNTHQAEVCRALAVAISSLGNPVSSLLHLESLAPSKDRSRVCKLSVLGCAILQTIFTFSKDCNKEFLSRFVGLEREALLEAANDQAGSHVVEAFLKSSSPSNGQKRCVIEKLRGHFADLALHGSHYLVLKCYDAADMQLKEAITSELLAVQASLSKTKQGPYLLMKLNVAKYAAQRETWKSSEHSKQVVREAFSDLFQGPQKSSETPHALKQQQPMEDELSKEQPEQNTRAKKRKEKKNAKKAKRLKVM